MSTPTDTRHADLERRLRAAADAVPSRPVPADAWVGLQSRLATRDGRHGRRILAAAAVVALLLALVGAAALLDDGSRSAGPAGGSTNDDFWAPENYLGEPFTAENLTLGGRETRHELVLSDTTGKGPSLCDRYVDVANDASAGGCTSRDQDADSGAVAFDWLTGNQGGGVHGVEGAVDDRVMKVQVWMDNGDQVLATLHPTGWEGTRGFALTVPDSGPTPQRLVAYSDATGTVLQSVDLGDAFGSDWLPPGGRSCSGAATGTWPQPGSGGTGDVSVSLWSGSAQVSDIGQQGVGSSCLRLESGALAGTVGFDDHVIVVTGPEVVTVEWRSSGTTVAGSSRKVAPSATSPFQVADVPVSPQLPPDARLVALDVTGHVVDATNRFTNSLP
jgi:hypothetical protein